MGISKQDTAARIMEHGRQEFLECGYERASMRSIARKAEVTTGAIYGYFPGKEALFEALIGDATEGLFRQYQQRHDEFAGLPADDQAGKLEEITEVYIIQMVDYIYDHLEAFKLLFCSSPKGYVESYLKQFVELEEESCWNFLRTMETLGYEVMELDDTLVHILSRSFFQQLEAFILHDVPRAKARAYTIVLGRFQHAGWLRIVGVLKP